jgi:NADH-quinone oxidoreductase subunit N
MLAYSSIAHSGYMLVGVIAGPGAGRGPFWATASPRSLFYLLCYGVMNLGAFAVLACLERKGEASRRDRRHPRPRPHAPAMLGWSPGHLLRWRLLGFPPLLGFIGKVGLFTSGIASRRVALVVMLAHQLGDRRLYYLRLVAAALLEQARRRAGRAGRPPARAPGPPRAR